MVLEDEDEECSQFFVWTALDPDPGLETSAAATTCESLADLKLPNTTITTAQTLAAGAFTPPSSEAGMPMAVSYKELPAFCRVTGVIKPTSESDIKFEVWMPSAGWNGKFQGIGNGGFAGSITYRGLAGALSRGYATASTDTGHSGPGAELGGGPSGEDLSITGIGPSTR